MTTQEQIKTAEPVTANPYVLFPLISAFCIVQFLFFIDEGYYSFAWMKDFGAWIVFIIYVGIFFIPQYLFGRLLFKRSKGIVWASLAFFVGLPFSIFLMIQMF